MNTPSVMAHPGLEAVDAGRLVWLGMVACAGFLVWSMVAKFVQSCGHVQTLTVPYPLYFHAVISAASVLSTCPSYQSPAHRKEEYMYK